MSFGDFLCKGNKAVKVLGIILAIQLIFGLIYGLIFQFDKDIDNSWSHSGMDTPFLNGFYASTIITTSVGFGDFYPKNAIGKLLIKIHGASVFLLILYAGTVTCI
jgi:predicted membrane protein